MLENLPPELVEKIISFLGLRDVMSLCCTCKDLHSIFQDFSNTYRLCYYQTNYENNYIIHRYLGLQYLQLVPENGKIRKKENIDMKMVLSDIHVLFGRLRVCPPPCSCKSEVPKYLQIDCTELRQILIGVSLLPPTLREMMELVDTTNNSVMCFTLRSKIILGWLFQKEEYFPIIADTKKIEQMESEEPKLIESFFSFNKFKCFLESVAECEERLDFVKEMYCKIRSRGLFENAKWLAWIGPSAQIREIISGSSDQYFRPYTRGFLDLICLIKLNNQSPLKYGFEPQLNL